MNPEKILEKLINIYLEQYGFELDQKGEENEKAND